MYRLTWHGRRLGIGIVAWLISGTAWGQLGGGGGGVHIDAEGVLRVGSATLTAPRRPAPHLAAELAKRSDWRRVSLKALASQARQCAAELKPLPEAIRYLAGLTKLEYVAFDSANADIVLVGPAEGWVFASDGRAIGRNSKRPVLQLDDLAAALRCVLIGNGEASCSIDPQAKGLAAIRAYEMPIAQSKAEADRVRKEAHDRLGLQTVRTGGILQGSRFAIVMIDADYRMKRLALGMERSAGVTNHLDTLVQQNARGRVNTNLARWWFTTSTQPVVANAENTLFKLPEMPIKLLNEEVAFDDQGRRTGLGRSNPDWDRFANSFNQQLKSLERAIPAFADLHNLYDLMIAAALIQRHAKADWLAESILLDEKRYTIAVAKQPAWAEPAVAYRLDTKVENAGRRILFTMAYGGVSMRPARLVQPGNLRIDGGSELQPLAKALAASPDALPGAGAAQPGKAAPIDDSQAAPRKVDAASPIERAWWSDLDIGKLPRGKQT